MFTISWPSLPKLGLSVFSKKGAIDLRPVKVHESETAQDKPGRALKHLLKLNHVEHGLFVQRSLPSQLPELLCASFLQGAGDEDLGRIYEDHVKSQVKWEDSPAEVTHLDWRDYLGCREYDRAFVNFFEDELARLGYDWREVVAEYLFEGKEPMFNSIMGGLGAPLIHLAHAFEVSSREMAMEALGLAATCHSSTFKELEDAVQLNKATYESKFLFEILDHVRQDKELDNLFSKPDSQNLKSLITSRNSLLLKHWSAWKIENAMEQFRESQELAAALLVGTSDPESAGSGLYNSLFAVILTTSHAVRVMLPLIPAQFQIPLLRQWWLTTVAIYISQLRPEIDSDRILGYNLKGRDWKWTAEKAVKGKFSTDAQFVKVIRALKELSLTWGDSESFFLKAAVRFTDEFQGWRGDFVGDEL